MAKPLFVSSFIGAQNSLWTQKNADIMNQILFLDEIHLLSSGSLGLRDPLVEVTVPNTLTFACILCMKLVKQVIFSYTRLTADLMAQTFSPRLLQLLMSSLTFAVVLWVIDP